MQVTDSLLGGVYESPVVGPSIAGYVAEEQVAEFCVLHITRTLVHKTEALLYQGGFPHERGAVVVVKYDIEGCISRLIVKLGNLVAEGFLLTLFLCCGRIKVGDVVQRVFSAPMAVTVASASVISITMFTMWLNGNPRPTG